MIFSTWKTSEHVEASQTKTRNDSLIKCPKLCCHPNRDDTIPTGLHFPITKRDFNSQQSQPWIQNVQSCSISIRFVQMEVSSKNRKAIGKFRSFAGKAVTLCIGSSFPRAAVLDGMSLTRVVIHMNFFPYTLYASLTWTPWFRRYGSFLDKFRPNRRMLPHKTQTCNMKRIHMAAPVRPKMHNRSIQPI